ncbi:hypothetical protein [Kribbella sp. NPDC004536]|uniref:hypothetical protein n=1 Tax=Kribbella sp. NPDC004536 TaxID=3364106 RepID=UPI0036B170E0
MKIRRVIAILGLPVLLLGLVTTSAAAGSAPSQAPAIVNHSVDHEHCDPIRFLKP